MLSISLIAAFPELAEHALDYGVTSRAAKLGLWRYQGFGLHVQKPFDVEQQLPHRVHPRRQRDADGD